MVPGNCPNCSNYDCEANLTPIKEIKPFNSSTKKEERNIKFIAVGYFGKIGKLGWIEK